MAALPSWATGKALIRQYTHQLLLGAEPRYPCCWHPKEKEFLSTARSEMLQGKQRLDPMQLLNLVL